MNNYYDSSKDTKAHISRIQTLMVIVIQELSHRALVHDQSKLESPEKELFDKYTPILNSLTYGSKEYQESLDNLKVALDHHYKYNTHHPENVFANEIWKDINGFNGIYQVSNIGRIKRLEKSVDRNKQGILKFKELILKPHVTPKGYVRIRLQNKSFGKNYFIHTLVATAFIGNPPSDRHQVNHKDGNKLNNNHSNLEWLTPSENTIHAYENDLKQRNLKYVVYCKELDITTFGLEKMSNILKKMGYENVTSAGIWRCINSHDQESTHYNLHFKSYNIDEYQLLNSPINNMDLFDIIEMFIDWKAAGERNANGNIYKSIKINKQRFGISDQLENIFNNTAKKMGF